MGKKLNAMEQSIVDGLNGITSSNGAWKLFSTRYVKSNFELKSDKEKKLYSAIVEFLSDKDTSISVLPCNKFTTLFIDWSNEKLIELPGILVDVKMIEKCLKYYWLKNHLTLNRYFALAMKENDDKVYIVSVCRESAIYQLKESAETSADDSDSENSETSEETKNLLKINSLLNSVASLAKSFDNDTKKEIVNSLASLLNVSNTSNKAELQIIKNA